MSAATASITDVSRTNFINGRDLSSSVQSQNQCTPMPLPALGTQKIIQGNGTNVGTIISLQCPAKHKLMGGELTCVLGPNSTQWVGQNYCKPLSPFEDYGFRVAVLASIVSSAIIFFMSMAFITCCLLDCIKEDKRKQHESDPDMWQWEEPPQQQEDRRSRYSPKSRNNNNNNTQEKLSSLWDTSISASCENMRASRYHQQYTHQPVCTCGPVPLLSALPGCDYDQPLLPRNPQYAQISGEPPQCSRPPQSTIQSASPGPDQVPAVGSGRMWQYGGHQTSLSGGNPSNTDEANMRNLKKEFSIRIISV
nr:sushi domain-containing protein 3-like [Labrus bergylta]